MPIREFHCPDCSNDFEKIVKASQELSEVTCPSCGGNHLEKKLSTFSARANASANSAAAPMGCPGGMCSMPGMCGAGRN